MPSHFGYAVQTVPEEGGVRLRSFVTRDEAIKFLIMREENYAAKVELIELRSRGYKKMI